MLKAKYRWNVKFPETVPDELIFDRILKNRGIDDAEAFFTMGKEAFHDPFLFEDMAKSVNRIYKAVSSQEKIMIYGDYDCDGISAISVLYRALKKIGANVFYDLPDRFSDGYGLSMRAVEEIIASDVKLVITVDNGITCFEEMERLAEVHIDAIITDHHEILGNPPKAFAILHADLSKTYPFKDLAGVGLSYKLACAVLGNDLDDLVDLVMVGTVADLVPLHGENQALVNLGLAQLKKTVNPGLKKLLQFSHLDQINETAIAFKIAPKINSSGRMGKAKAAVQLLISDSDEEVNRLILEIETNHAERKDLTDEAYRECERLVDLKNTVLVLASPSFHEGVIGICAQKIAEKYQRSTCVICLGEDGIGKGSMRSFGDEDILSLLGETSLLLIRYGGHSQAAGLAIEMGKIPLFQARLNEIAKIKDQSGLAVDMKVLLSGVSTATIKTLERYSFFSARFLFSGLKILSKTVMTGKHTKFVVTDGKKTMEAILFNNMEYFYRLEEGDLVDIVGAITLNSWRNNENLQIMIKDMSCSHFQVLDLRDKTRFVEALPHFKTAENTLILSDEFPMKDFDLPALFAKNKPTTVVVGYSEKANMISRIFSKEGIGSVYRMIEHAEPVTMDHLTKLSKNPDWIIQSIVQVFEELDLIKSDSGTIRTVVSLGKKNLTDSKTYNKVVTDKQKMDFLLQEPIPVIKQYFTNLLEA